MTRLKRQFHLHQVRNFPVIRSKRVLVTLLRHLCGLAFAGALCAQSLTITSSSPLPTGGQGIPYFFNFTATGGAQPYTWTQIGGALPNGLMLGLATGSLNGIPTTGGVTSNVTIQVTDMVGGTSSASFSIKITPPVAINNPSPLPSGTLGAMYSQTLTASGGTPPYWCTVVAARRPFACGLPRDCPRGGPAAHCPLLAHSIRRPPHPPPD